MKILHGWKEVANVVGIHPQTARVWHRTIIKLPFSNELPQNVHYRGGPAFSPVTSDIVALKWARKVREVLVRNLTIKYNKLYGLDRGHSNPRFRSAVSATIARVKRRGNARSFRRKGISPK